MLCPEYQKKSQKQNKPESEYEWDMCVLVCVLVSLLILYNLHALPLFLLLPPLLLLLLTVDEEPPQQEQQQQQKQPQKVGEKKRPFTMQSNCLRCRKEKGRAPRWLPGLRLLKLAASQFLPKSSGKKLMDCYLVVSLAHHPLLLPLPRPLCVQLKCGIFVSHIRGG